MNGCPNKTKNELYNSVRLAVLHLDLWHYRSRTSFTMRECQIQATETHVLIETFINRRVLFPNISSLSSSWWSPDYLLTARPSSLGQRGLLCRTAQQISFTRLVRKACLVCLNRQKLINSWWRRPNCCFQRRNCKWGIIKGCCFWSGILKEDLFQLNSICNLYNKRLCDFF